MRREPFWKTWWAARVYRATFSCREAIRLQSQSLDRPLTFGERFKLGWHKSICSYCRRYGRQICLIRGAAPELDKHLETAEGAKLPPEVRQRIKDSLR